MYLQVVAICCLAITHSTLCKDDVHNVMTRREIHMVFQTPAEKVPHHEFVPITMAPQDTYSHQGRPAIRKGMKVWLKTFGSTINLWLHPRRSYLLHEDTPVYHVRASAYEPGHVAFEERHGAMDRVGQLYEDPKHWASLVIGTDLSRKTRVNGHIVSKRLTIRSLPDNVIKTYLRTRRSIDEPEYNSSNVSYVVVYRNPNKMDKEFSLNDFDGSNFGTDEQAYIPTTLYLQILLVVENSLYTKLGSDDTNLLEYLSAFWNAVDMKYRDIQRPQIKLSISAIIIATGPRGTPYISRNRIGRGVFEANRGLLESTYFFFDIQTKFSLDSYDVGVTITTQKLGGKGNGATMGLAYGGTACKRTSHSMNSVAMIHDDGSFFGIDVAAHELGHNLGIPHDDPEFVTCPPKDGYIMAGNVQYSLNSSSFSNCSLDSFEKRLHDNQFKCLYNQPAVTDYGLPKIMPGKLISRSERCKTAGYHGNCTYGPADLCDRLSCEWNHFCYPTGIPVLEGTPCGSWPNMFCLRRRCTQMRVPSAKKLQEAKSRWINRRKNANGKY